MRIISTLLRSLLVLATLAPAGLLLNVPNARPKVSKNWDTALSLTWQGLKTRNIDAYTTGMIHRPKSESPGDIVSESQGYGMILALFSGDQKTFNSIWAASETKLWTGNGYNWRADVNGSVAAIGGQGIATDADQDIAFILIFADKLVQKGIWPSYSLPNGGPTYAQRAQVMLNEIWSKLVASVNVNGAQSYILAPGEWGGWNTFNPGYCAPAYYRIFKDYDATTTHDWMTLLNQCYTSIAINPGDSIGVGPDWMTGAGQLLSNGPGYNAFDKGHSMYKDGIRILWRVATDALWFNEARAKTFLTSSMAFLNRNGGATYANFFDMKGKPCPKDSLFIFDGGKINRPRYEHSHLTIGMWATAAMAVGTNVDREAMSREMQLYYTPGTTFFGRATDSANEDTLHNEMYFDQFLAWFGTAMMDGAYSNIIYDLDNPPPVSTIATRTAQASRLLVKCKGRNVQILLENGQAQHLSIMDTKGQQLISLAVGSDGTSHWDASSFEPGLYIAIARNASQQWTRSFVVH